MAPSLKKILLLASFLTGTSLAAFLPPSETKDGIPAKPNDATRIEFKCICPHYMDYAEALMVSVDLCDNFADPAKGINTHYKVWCRLSKTGATLDELEKIKPTEEHCIAVNPMCRKIVYFRVDANDDWGLTEEEHEDLLFDMREMMQKAKENQVNRMAKQHHGKK